MMSNIKLLQEHLEVRDLNVLLLLNQKLFKAQNNLVKAIASMSPSPSQALRNDFQNDQRALSIHIQIS